MGKSWILRLDLVSEISLPVAILVMGIGSIVNISWLVRTGLTMLALSFVLFGIWQFCYFNYIKCPQCGHNPTRTKEGRRKKNFRAIATEVSKLTNCPKCGH